jgi:hypothetical protein
MKFTYYIHRAHTVCRCQWSRNSAKWPPPIVIPRMDWILPASPHHHSVPPTLNPLFLTTPVSKRPQQQQQQGVKVNEREEETTTANREAYSIAIEGGLEHRHDEFRKTRKQLASFFFRPKNWVADRQILSRFPSRISLTPCASHFLASCCIDKRPRGRKIEYLPSKSANHATRCWFPSTLSFRKEGIAKIRVRVRSSHCFSGKSAVWRLGLGSGALNRERERALWRNNATR